MKIQPAQADLMIKSRRFKFILIFIFMGSILSELNLLVIFNLPTMQDN
jgi:hypothetical protein